MIGRLFRAHGEFCASHPWEVIVALLTLTACMLTVDKQAGGGGVGVGVGAGVASMTVSSATSSRHRPCHGWSQSCDGLEAEYNAADVILMTIVRCTAVLYCYYQFCSLHKLGSKYILGEYLHEYACEQLHWKQIFDLEKVVFTLKKLKFCGHLYIDIILEKLYGYRRLKRYRYYILIIFQCTFLLFLTYEYKRKTRSSESEQRTSEQAK